MTDGLHVSQRGHGRGVEETLRKMLEQKLREQGAAPAAPAGR